MRNPSQTFIEEHTKEMNLMTHPQIEEDRRAKGTVSQTGKGEREKKIIYIYIYINVILGETLLTV